MKKNFSLENSSLIMDKDYKVKGADLMHLNTNMDTVLDNMTAFVLPFKYKSIDKNGETVPDGSEGSTVVFDPFQTYNMNNINKAIVFRTFNKEDIEFEFNRLLSTVESRRVFFEYLQKAIDKKEVVLTEELIAKLKKEQEENGK